MGSGAAFGYNAFTIHARTVFPAFYFGTFFVMFPAIVNGINFADVIIKMHVGFAYINYTFAIQAASFFPTGYGGTIRMFFATICNFIIDGDSSAYVIFDFKTIRAVFCNT
jgi:hypothetical protein